METQSVYTKKPAFLLWIGISVVILVGIGVVLLVEQSRKKDAAPATTSESTSVAPNISATIPPAMTEAELKAQFISSLQTTGQQIDSMSAGTNADLVSAIEDKLLAVRVPLKNKDAYMEFFLKIDKLKENTNSVEENKKTIRTLIGSFVLQAG